LSSHQNTHAAIMGPAPSLTAWRNRLAAWLLLPPSMHLLKGPSGLNWKFVCGISQNFVTCRYYKTSLNFLGFPVIVHRNSDSLAR
jgi:hypothetical protein